MEKKENKFTPNEISEDKKISLRPKKITEFVGQDNIKSNLKTFIAVSYTHLTLPTNREV